MRESPWLTPESIGLAGCIVASHERAFGRPLLACGAAAGSAPDPRLLAQELFAADTVVLAHDGAPLDQGEGPRLTYANRAALRLWRRDWAAMVGMPSSRTAEPAERASRQQALTTAQQQLAITNYSGIRIDSRGRRFAITGARIWTLRDASGLPCGQAAAFSDLHWL
ncbi:MAG: MEKHLA domain-containing protein [Cyanobacteria bacterium K_DeepCast_35m_m2_023]|nr:MEKHLA domain-containing protein [Cyanobacteria bacterium K_DeepCast_35m_m2_023]